MIRARRLDRNLALAGVVGVWGAGVAAMLVTLPPRTVAITHWANGHMMDSAELFPEFAEAFNAEHRTTEAGRRIEVRLARANSGEISGELKSRVLYGSGIDTAKEDPVLVTPAADHWVVDVNHALGQNVLELGNVQSPAATYIGVVTSREMARCLGWPGRAISLDEIVKLTSAPDGWSSYAHCARPEWGTEARVAFTYPSRSSTARSVLYTLHAVAAGKHTDQLTIEDVNDPDNAAYVHGFQTAIDCYVPDTLDLNLKLLDQPDCAHFYFIAEDNLVKLYQGKISRGGESGGAGSLERDLVMLYPTEGSILHNHSAFVVNAPFVSADQTDGARKWVAFLQEENQQRAFMQEGFRRTTAGPCIAPLGSPFSPCASTPETVIYPDRIDAAVAAAILRAWN